MMDGEIVRIERAKNGFTVEMRDPKIDEQNRKRRNGKDDEEVDIEHRSPFVSYVFESVEAVLAFLGENLEKAMPLDEFETSFKEAVKEDE